MNQSLRKACVVIILTVTNFIFSPLHAQQTLTTVNGWNAYVHLPANYNSTTTTYPTIVFFPGLGEVGTVASKVIANGPGAYITQGWDGNVVVNGSTVEFIVISLQPPSAFPNEATMNTRLQTIKSTYRVDPNRLYLTGLSHGGWCSSTFVTGDAYGGPYTYASQIAAVVTVEGMMPDDNQPYPNLFDNFALSGGKYLGFEQSLDGRDTRTVVDRMNLTAPNSGVYVQTTFGGGGHCCWNQFYGGQGTQPGIFPLGGISQNLYQWLARQTLAPNTNLSPIPNAGPDKTITLPVNSTTINGSAIDPDGTILSYLWSQVSGPGAATLSGTNTATLNVSALLQGQYKFSLKVTDNNAATAMDTMILTVNPAATTCNTNAPVTYTLNFTTPGEIYRPNGSMWKGGDTVKITGTSYSAIEFYNIAGDPCRPIVIMPATTLTTPVFRIKGNSRYLKIWGGNTPYGIKINGGPIALTMCNHIEVDNVECFGGSTGVYCKQDVVYSDTMTWHPNYRMSKFTFKNMWVHDINGEGMYIGITQPNGLTVTSTYSGMDTIIQPIRLDSVEVSNCIVERTTWDGIQLSNARDGNKIFNNIVRDYGTLNISSQQAGIILGSNCNGDVYGNNVSKGTGNGIELFGYGIVNVYNNTLDSCGYDGNTNPNGTQGQQSIYASDFLTPTESNPKQTMNVYGNTINHPKTAGAIFITGYYNNSLPSSVYNNTFCIPGAAANWQSIYIKSYVPGSNASNNILSCATVPNVAPTANAGNDITITLPTVTATLTGSGTDPDGTIASYQWTKISGPVTGIIATATSAATAVNSLVLGVYKFELLVTDNSGATDTDTVQVTVNPTPNVAPVANAGSDVTITLPVNTTNLTGSGTDIDGTIASYQWTKISGPATGTIANATSAAAIANNLVQGVYQFQLRVTDNNGATGTDVMQVTVNPAPNQAPTANAGTDITITLPTNTTPLAGSGIDPDGTIASYLWTKISGPATGTIANATSAAATANNLVQGVYQFQLRVTDNSGATATDIVQVTVNPAPNQAPTANAGTDITITLPTNTTSLTGSGTDPDGTIASYAWVKISGPATGTIANATSAAATANNLVQGVYQFQLTVTDNSGATASDMVQVTVNPAPNQAPVADAGTDIVITLPVNTANLSGNGTDADGTIATYQWTQVAGPNTAIFGNATTAATTVSNLIEGVYQFQLQVTDNNGATATDITFVIVNAAMPPPNQAPTANAGLDQVMTLPATSTTLSGSGTDPDGTIVGYAWIKLSGPSVMFGNPNAAITGLGGLSQGVYQFQLTVTDNNGATATDIVQVTVNPAPNQVPTANAGTDITITLPTNTTALTGSGTDPDGSIASYAWVKIAGPATGNISNAAIAVTSADNLVQGVYQFQLTVTDNNGATATDVIQVTVNPAPNQAPTANAGTDITITLPVNTTPLTGSGTDADGTIATYSWVKISGPATGTVTNANTATATAANLVQGVYQFELTVTDNSGATATDVVQVTVNPIPNQAPTANAGSDITITLPVNTTVLVGIGNDPDGTVTAFQWTKIAGPVAGTIASPASANTTISALVQGTYKFELQVTDNNGATGRDTVQVTVNAAVPPPNQLPVANAGLDKVVSLPTTAITLAGSGTDPDGTITGYQWTKLSGPSCMISSPAAAITGVGGLSIGVYLFELKVTDNSGATDTDTMQVTVNPAPNVPPVANAGPDQNMTLPANTANLSGSGTDADGTITGYAWTKIAGPAAGTITNPTSAATTVTGMVQGLYKFELRVTDNSGATDTDTMQVTVNPVPNVPPVAHAGLDQNMTLPANATNLNGSGTDTDGTITGYAWTKIAGPSAGTIASPAAASTGISGLVQGVYRFELKVTDNNGATGRDTIQVSVNSPAPPPNQRPVADAGNDISIYLPVNATPLYGSGTDVDGTIVSYQWRILPTTGLHTLLNLSSAQANLNDLQQGIYEAELTVTDDDGATGKDTVKISVGASRIEPGEDVKIYPNPVQDNLNIQISTSKVDRKAKLVIMDIRGSVVLQKEVMVLQNSQVETIDMKKYSKGDYFLRIQYEGEKSITRKIIKL